MKLAQRIHYHSWLTEGAFDHLRGFLADKTGLLDELTMMTEYTHHGYRPIEEVTADADSLAVRMAALREMGFASVGVNVLDSIGHIDEGYSIYPSPFVPIVGYDGQRSKSCFCPVHTDFREYLAKKYALIAAAKPDFLWVDDDIKLFWNGVKFGCFCPACMERFGKRTGFPYTRETLVAAMEEPNNVALRAAFVQDTGDKITELLAIIREAVRKVSPGLPLGFMTQHQGWSTYNGMAYGDWFGALDACKGRPGEGFYDDSTPEQVCTKVLSTARQAAEYPVSVTDVQYEVENFPYHLFQKSRRIVLDECTLAMAAGMNSILLNTLKIEPHTNLAEHGLLYRDIALWRPTWDEMERFSRGFAARGFYPAVSSRYDRLRPLHDGQSFFTLYNETDNHNVMRTYCLAQLGIPLSMEPAGACGVILTGDLPDGYTDSELEVFFSKAVLMDGEALTALERRGLGHLAGVRRKIVDSDSVYEHFNADHPLNKGLGDEYRDVRLAFFQGSAAVLEPLTDGVQVLSELERYDGKELGPAATLYQNDLGGRVCTLGYAAFHKITSLSRRIQLNRVCRWLAEDAPPSEILSDVKAAQFVRSSPDGKRSMVTLLNLSLDDTGEVQLAVRSATRGNLILPGQDSVELIADCRGGDGVFTLPSFAAFETMVLLAECE